MKAFLAITSAILGISVSAQAQSLPDPVTCGRDYQNGVQISHSGPFSLFGAYHTTLRFNNRGEVSVSTTEGRNQTQIVNAFTMRDRIADGAHFAKYNHDCAESGNRAQDCAVEIQELLNYLERASKKSYATAATRQRENSAISCARSIALSTVRRSQQSTSGLSPQPVQALTDEQALQVSTNMRALKAAQDAEDAADTAQITATTSQIQSINTQISVQQNTAVGRR